MVKLLNEVIINALPLLRSTESIHLANKTIICKFHAPESGLNWYMFEGEKNKDPEKLYTFFGLFAKETLAANEVYMAYFHLGDLIRLMDEGHDIQVDMTIWMAPYQAVLSKVVDKAWPICQNFLIEKIIRALPPLYSTEHIPLNDRKIICQFCLSGYGGWYVFEGEFNHETGYRFFGIVNGIEKESGYFELGEFLKVEKQLGVIFTIKYSSALNPIHFDNLKAESSD